VNVILALCASTLSTYLASVGLRKKIAIADIANAALPAGGHRVHLRQDRHDGLWHRHPGGHRFPTFVTSSCKPGSGDDAEDRHLRRALSAWLAGLFGGIAPMFCGPRASALTAQHGALASLVLLAWQVA